MRVSWRNGRNLYIFIWFFFLMGILILVTIMTASGLWIVAANLVSIFCIDGLS